MPSGEWAFLTEYAIYDYINYRFKENQLYLRKIIQNGKRLAKTENKKVTDLDYITDTSFPDIKGIKISGETEKRQAEIKFITSKFKYHKEEKTKFEEFIRKNGYIISLYHDKLPKGIGQYNIDVFQLDLNDFINYSRENFIRLLHRQINYHDEKKIWLMYAPSSRNFYQGTKETPPAYISGRWCPSDKLTNFDLSIGDKVLFINTKGRSWNDVKKKLKLDNEILDKWILNEIFVCTVTSSIRSRKEYCDLLGIDDSTPLWYDETEKGQKDSRIKKSKHKTWNEVFEFSVEKRFRNLNLSLQKLSNENKEFYDLVLSILNVFADSTSREISLEMYISFIEYLLNVKNEEFNNLLFVEDNEIQNQLNQLH